MVTNVEKLLILKTLTLCIPHDATIRSMVDVLRFMDDVEKGKYVQQAQKWVDAKLTEYKKMTFWRNKSPEAIAGYWVTGILSHMKPGAFDEFGGFDGFIEDYKRGTQKSGERLVS